MLVVYGGPGETNEMAFTNVARPRTVEGKGVKVAYKKSATVLQFDTSSQRRVLEFGNDLAVYILGECSEDFGIWHLVPKFPQGKSKKPPIVPWDHIATTPRYETTH